MSNTSKPDSPHSEIKSDGQPAPPPSTTASSAAPPVSASPSVTPIVPASVAGRLSVLFAWTVVVALFFWFFAGAVHILLLFLAAATISSTLRPLVRRLSRRRWVSGPIVALGFWLVIVIIIGLLAWLLQAPILAQIERWPQIKHTLNDALAQISHWFSQAPPPTVEQIAAQARAWIMGGNAGSVLAQTVSSIIGIAIALLLIVFGSIFLVAEPAGVLMDPIFRRLPKRHALALLYTIQDLETKLRQWLFGTVVSMFGIGFLTWAGLALGGFEFALPMAAITGAAQIIPTIGAIGSAVLALLLALTQGPGQVATVLIVYVFLHVIESYVLIPFIMREAVRIPPIVSLFSIVLWAELLGPLGLLLALPLDLTLWCFFYHFVQAKDVDESSIGPRQ